MTRAGSGIALKQHGIGGPDIQLRGGYFFWRLIRVGAHASLNQLFDNEGDGAELMVVGLGLLGMTQNGARN